MMAAATNEQVVFVRPGVPLELRKSTIPQPGPDEVLVRVAYCGICGSELHLLADPKEMERAKMPSGQVLGHEYSGTVEAVGPGVDVWQTGDAVSCLPRLPCGRCARCRADEHFLCEDFWRPTDKAWAELALVRQEQLRRVPNGLSLRKAALAEPLAHCVQAVDVAEWKPSSTALVVGAGPMGLLLVATLAAAGARTLFVTEKSDYRLKLAVGLGAQPLNNADPLAELKAETTGDGVDVSFECVGSAGAFSVAYDAVRRGGRLVQVGVPPFDVPTPLAFRDLWVRMITIVPACGIESTWDRALAWLLKLPVDQIITHDFPLARANEAIAMARSGKAGKVMLQPNNRADARAARDVDRVMSRVS
jgi:threonine dehydrogenase-like Zn-dependent dehydrogenase